MKFIAGIFMAAACFLAMAGSASAQVRYQGDILGQNPFNFVTPSFIVAQTNFTPAECGCAGGLSIWPDQFSTGSGISLWFGQAGNDYFRNDALNNFGSYTGDNGSALTVSSAVAAAPEPDLWAMLILGFGIAGTALRRRPRRKNALFVVAGI